MKINSIWYVKQIMAHRSRVVKISKDIFGKSHTVTKMMKWHDLEKLFLLPFMIYTWKFKPSWSRAFYNILNDVGTVIHSIVFRGSNQVDRDWLDWCAQWEKVIDVTDRAFDKNYELEFNRCKSPIDNFLSVQELEMHRIIKHYWIKHYWSEHESLGAVASIR